MTKVLDRSKSSLKSFLLITHWLERYSQWRQKAKRKTYIHNRLVKDLEAPSTLVNDSIKDLVKDHLGELGLDLGSGEFHKASNVGDFDSGVGLNDSEEILFQESVIESSQVRANNWVVSEFLSSD